jgi:ubiquinol-cytochrome c reductase cytochrome c1 subunit
MKSIIKTLAFGVIASAALMSGAWAAGDAAPVKKVEWSFNGPFGTFDRAQLQRGYQVYKEVCAACHSMKYLAFRNLADLGFDEAEVKALAAGYEVEDGPNDDGDMFTRPGRPSDYFPSPFANEKQARAANNGAYPPDLSLIAKARMGGPDYIYSLLTGYSEPPADVEMGDGMHYNVYFSGGQIAMAPPLSDDIVTYADGTSTTVDQMAKDVAAYLMWAAEPKLEERKSLGFRVMIFLVIMTGLFYLINKKVWAPVKRGEQV